MGGHTSWLVMSLLLLFAGITFLAGTYPALFLAAFQPLKVLKQAATAKAGGTLLRKSLVVVQFAISSFLIVCTLVVVKQRWFIQHKDLGLDRSFIMTMDVDGRLKNNLAAFKNSLLANASIRAVSASYDSPINIQGGYSLTKAEGQPDGFNMSIAAIPTEKDFTTTMGLTLVAGSALTDADIQQLQPDSASKAEPYYHFTLNESAAKALGWKPETAIGKKITMNGRSGEIKAVVKDFHFASMHEPIAPIILFPEYNYFGKLLVKVAGNSLSAAEAHLQHVWRSYFPQIPFEYHFLDQEFEQLYKAEQRTSWILNCFSVITIFISCLGLLGLSAYTTSQRTKEIGIRKVLGASVNNILQLVAADFLKLVVIAVIVATPLAWWAMSDWLRQFAYRITLSWWLFVVAGLAALSIALVTVSFQSVKAALANPVKSLKNRE
jgi:putative ABC transport system permease protein